MKPARILLVDDSPLFLRALCELVSQHPDLEIVGQATSGFEAIRLTAELSPDLVTMDVVMPQMNGLLTLRQLKQQWPALPIVLITLYSTRSIEAAARLAGASEFIAKKDVPERLIPVLQQLLAEKSSAGDEILETEGQPSTTIP